MKINLNTPFQCYNAIINGTLQTFEEVYCKALGEDPEKPSESRIAVDPVGVMADFARLLQSATLKLNEAMDAIREMSLDDPA